MVECGWVACDTCGKWRRLKKDIMEWEGSFVCKDNTWSIYRSCTTSEEVTAATEEENSNFKIKKEIKKEGKTSKSNSLKVSKAGSNAAQAPKSGSGSKRQTKRQQEKMQKLLELQQVKLEEEQQVAVVSPTTRKKRAAPKTQAAVPGPDGWRQWDTVEEGVSLSILYTETSYFLLVILPACFVCRRHI